VLDRRLVWDGCLNVRDLGGHPTEDGATTRFGAVVRADNVRLLSENGWNELVEYGVRRIVDLRYAAELAEDPPQDVPIDVVHISLLGPDGSTEEIDELVRHITETVPWRRAVYLEFLERFAPNFAQAAGAVAQAPSGCVLVHCAGGVDRTGLVAALLLRVAGVPPEIVAADYAASESSWAPHVEEWIEETDDERERVKRRLLSRMPAEAMLDVLTELERRHGSAGGYLLEAGLREADLDRIRTRLRT
jgi:protein-tyrosine phosphatase